MSSRRDDRAGEDYWEGVWSQAELPHPVDSSDTDFRNRPNRVFASYFHPVLAGLPEGATVLEVGCGHSAWLPYFARRYGVSVAGIDYSEAGCEAEREILRRSGVSGQVVLANLFEPPDALLESADVVISMGVVEHFDDTKGCLEAISRMVKPGGKMITTIPNVTGAVGRLQRAVNRPVFDIHRPLDRAELADAHRAAGLRVEDSSYLLTSNFGVVNLQGVPEGPQKRRRELLLRQLTRLSKLVWIAEDRFGALPAIRVFAGHAGLIARRPLP